MPGKPKGTSWAITSHHIPRRDVKTEMENVNKLRPRGEERGMPADKRAAMTEMDLELQLVALSFSGAPAN